MITTPKISQIPFDALLKGGIGYVLGSLAGVNEKLSAAVLTIASLVDSILFEIVNRYVLPFLNRLAHPHFNISPEALYTGTNAIVSTITILAAQNFDLISRRTAGICIFISAAILACRVNLLS